MNKKDRWPNIVALIHRRPDAYAIIAGNNSYPEIIGAVRFFYSAYGTLVLTEVRGLPPSTGFGSSPIFAMHIHEGGSCTGDIADPFSDAGTHYNPRGCPHPYHAGDLPPIFNANGYAFGATLTDRFTIDEIIGRTVIIHSLPDDFTTQPSGNAGSKIVCGEIVKRKKR